MPHTLYKGEKRVEGSRMTRLVQDGDENKRPGQLQVRIRFIFGLGKVKVIVAKVQRLGWLQVRVLPQELDQAHGCGPAQIVLAHRLALVEEHQRGQPSDAKVGV